jgi:hypothetical protein
MGDVTVLRKSAEAIGNDQVALRLRTFAELVEQGKYGNVNLVVSVLTNQEGEIRRFVTGEMPTVSALVGVLHMATDRFGRGEL